MGAREMFFDCVINGYHFTPEYCLQAVLKHGVELVIQQRYFHDDEAGMYLTKLESLLAELQLSS